MTAVVTLGETMLRLSPPDQQRIEQTDRLHYYVGGSESNVAVGLARLGLRALWLSRLTDNVLGRHIAGQLRAQGVDVSHVAWTNVDRVGLYFVEEGPAPRGNAVLYDRAGSAMSRITPDDLPADLFQPAQANHLHLTGITLALSASAQQTAFQALQLAEAAGWSISFDVNFRRQLWSVAEARSACQFFLEAADVLFIAQRDTRLFFDLPPDGTPTEVVRQVGERWPEALVVMTLGAAGAIARRPDGQIVQQPAFPASGMGRIGGGDAFVAGFLAAYLHHAPQSVDGALRWATAAAALKYSIPGDMPLIDRAQIERLLSDTPDSHFR